jgi:hypothetical protein
MQYPSPQELAGQADQIEQLARLPRTGIGADLNRLRSLSTSDLACAFGDEGYSSEWAELSAQLDSIQPIPDMKTGGVNPGDRRAIYHLIRYLRPIQILEIGTHVGASTMSISAALNRNGNDGHLVTVDIVDVNSFDSYWSDCGLRHSPLEAMNQLALINSWSSARCRHSNTLVRTTPNSISSFLMATMLQQLFIKRFPQRCKRYD